MTAVVSSAQEADDKPYDFVDSTHAQRMVDTFREQLDVGRFCDVEFVVRGTRLPAHRNVMAVSSEYFVKADFGKRVPHVVKVRSVSLHVFREFLRYVYTGAISVDSRNVGEFMHLADTFGVATLRSLVSSYLQIHVDKNTVFQFRELAETYGLTEALRAIDTYTAESADAILCMSKAVLQLSVDAVCNLITKCRPFAIQASLLCLLMRWVQVDRSCRQKHVSRLLSVAQCTQDDIVFSCFSELLPKQLSHGSSPSAPDNSSSLCLPSTGVQQVDQPALSDQTSVPINNRRMHKCRTCPYQAYTLHHVRRHSRAAHGTADLYNCLICGFSCSYIRQLNDHMKQHFTTLPLQCPVCNERFDRQKELINHITASHSSGDSFICQVCNLSFQTSESFSAHTATHRIEHSMDHFSYVCKNCKVQFDDSSAFTQHQCTNGQVALKTLARCQRIFRCQHAGCLYKTDKKSHFTGHLNSHINYRPHICSMCNKGFVERGHLTRHLKIHYPNRPFKCQHCDYSSTRADKLKEHTKRLHKNLQQQQQPARPVIDQSSQSTPDTVVATPTVQNNNQDGLFIGDLPTSMEHNQLLTEETIDFDDLANAPLELFWDLNFPVDNTPQPTSPLSLGEGGCRRGSFSSYVDSSLVYEQPRPVSLPPFFGAIEDHPYL